MILDNQPGLLDEDVAASTGEAADASAEDRGHSSQGDDAATSPVVGTGPDAASGGTDAGVCGPGAKACAGQCVVVTDPLFGCDDTACAPCALPNATTTCAAEAGCVVSTCTSGFADCNGVAADGCEADLASPATCGGCGLACPVLEHVTMACAAGTCTGACEAGFADCNADPEDGCERNLLEDKRHCGACDNRCRIGRCEQGTCVWP